MKNHIIISVLFVSLILSSCFKEIDTEPIPPAIDDNFVVEYAIREVQSFYRFYENTVLLTETTSNTSWDLAFESAGDGNRVLLGWASYSRATPSGKYNFSELTQDLFMEMDTSAEWEFDDPSFVNIIDSLTLPNHWEDGQIYLQKRGVSSDNYYAIQFISSTEDSYTFKYSSAQDLSQVFEAIVYRDASLNYVYFSYNTRSTIQVEPDKENWDILCTPYSGWWETDDPGVFAPFNMSGIMINNENGVRIAKVFDPDIEFEALDSASVYNYEFTDKKGAIGGDWKVLGAVNSSDMYSMDPDKKYLMKKYDTDKEKFVYFKLRVVDYKLNGVYHFPTIEFKYLGSE